MGADYYDVSIEGFTDDLALTLESLIQYLLKRTGEAPNPSAYEEIFEIFEGIADENSLKVNISKVDQ